MARKKKSKSGNSTGVTEPKKHEKVTEKIEKKEKDKSAKEEGSSNEMKKKQKRKRRAEEESSHAAAAAAPPPPNSFESIQPPLSNGVLKYTQSKQFKEMTPVQAATIPLFLTNKDVAVQAVTGSGKTLAFLIPVVEMLLRRTFSAKQIGALVLSPTRELANQTYTVAQELCCSCQLPQPLLLVGGRGSVRDDMQEFAKHKSDLVIATPGRLEDVLIRYDVLDMRELDVLVLDEADVLLDMGFDVTLQSIFSKLPRMRRTGLFSATGTATNHGGAGSRGLKQLMARAGMRNPVWVNVAIASKSTQLEQAKEQATPTSLSNYYVMTSLDEKLAKLVAFLQAYPDKKVIVFFLTCACVDFFGSALKSILDGIDIELLHGKLVQKRREKAMERYRQSSAGVLFCTDVAARGLDVSNIDWVVQFDAPQDPASFVHRVGRSARAGKSGDSLVFLTPKEESYIDFLKNRKVPLSTMPDLPTNQDTPDVLQRVRQLCMTDRDILEKGTKAFTSYVRAYKEHHCAFIFRFVALDLGALATSFALLRLPKMPELRDKEDKLSFTPAGPEINIHAIPFKDKAREAARQKRLAAELAAGGKNAKQIKAEQKAAERARKAKERREEAIAKGRNPKKKRGRQAQIFDEWDELAKEERLYKKLRRKKITQEQYDELMYGDTNPRTSDAQNNLEHGSEPE